MSSASPALRRSVCSLFCYKKPSKNQEGSAPIPLNGTANASGTPTGQTVTYQVISGPGSIAGNTLIFAGVGTVIGNVSVAANGIYTAASASFSIVVTSAPLTITVANVSHAAGAPNPVFSSTVSGLVNGDTLGGSILVTCSTTAITASPVGTYPISATVSGPASEDYATTIVHRTLTVTPVTVPPVTGCGTHNSFFDQVPQITTSPLQPPADAAAFGQCHAQRAVDRGEKEWVY